ncbi:platelet glycoprotein Ib alpha chain [Lates calcarifer]|uniref:Platelet glycoprotein Ib alpha chain n=1 Tax=Lates calcarifer TaxID=8187 RepID=A0A4W6F8M1_LATCA|nr:platelet glycoprotein Ib alpha chain [Lates calcarifer]
MQFFVLLFLLSHAMVTAVPGCLSDRDKDHRPRKNCTAAGFSAVPEGIEPSTKVLLFPGNVFSSLSWHSFMIFTEIYEIDFTGNKVPELTPSATPILPTLSVLRLGSNHLTSLSDSSFSACPALTELYLEKNRIDSLSDHTFSGLSKLEILDLSSNRIKVLPKLMLHPLPAIETLYLEDNKIKVMPDDWFSKKKEVPYLYLSANPWACSCSLGYLRRYLEDYEFNIYVRDGPLIKSDGESVVCDSPQTLKGSPVLSLEESDLCSVPEPEESGPTGDLDQTQTSGFPTAVTAIPTVAILPPTPPSPTTHHPPLPPTPPSPTTHHPPLPPTPPSPTTHHPPPPPTPPSPTTRHPPLPRTSPPPPPPPPLTTTIITTATPTSAAPATIAPTVVLQLYTEYHRVITWSWYQTFTSLIEWSSHSEEKSIIQGSLAGSHAFVTPPSPPVRPSTESPADMTTAVPATPGRTKSVPINVTSTIPTTPEPPTTAIPLWVKAAGGRRREKISADGAAGVFCFWLFAACVLLCVASAACILVTLARLVVWYRRVYKPLSVALAKRGGGSDGVRLLTYSRREEKEVAGEEGVMALYRSVLFIHKEREEAMEREDGGKEDDEGGKGGKERLLVTLKPTGSEEVKREDGGERGGREERGVYRKTLYRLLSKEEEIEGWRDVMEECRVSAEDGGRTGRGKDGGMERERSGGGGVVSRKRYSVILREETGEAGGAREERDWVVGGWEVKRGGGEEGEGGEQPRSSWGEWLAHYLPSMPWGVTMPPEGEAAE